MIFFFHTLGAVEKSINKPFEHVQDKNACVLDKLHNNTGRETLIEDTIALIGNIDAKFVGGKAWEQGAQAHCCPCKLDAQQISLHTLNYYPRKSHHSLRLQVIHSPMWWAYFAYCSHNFKTMKVLHSKNRYIQHFECSLSESKITALCSGLLSSWWTRCCMQT